MSLNLTVRKGERVEINGNIVVTVGDVFGSKCMLCIEAPREIPIVRGTVLDKAAKLEIDEPPVAPTQDDAVFSQEVQAIRMQLLSRLKEMKAPPSCSSVALLSIVASVAFSCNDILVHPMSDKAIHSYVKDALLLLSQLIHQLKTNENN